MMDKDNLDTDHFEKVLSGEIQKLITYKKEGYVFHGSANPDIEQLEPRPAIDVDETNRFNNDTAVFATPLLAASIIFACMSKAQIPIEMRDKEWYVSVEKDGIVRAGIPWVWKEYITKNIGYIYVLGGRDFEGSGGWQVKSKQATVPKDKITVSFGDFETFGGVTIWTEED